GDVPAGERAIALECRHDADRDHWCRGTDRHDGTEADDGGLNEGRGDLAASSREKLSPTDECNETEEDEDDVRHATRLRGRITPWKATREISGRARRGRRRGRRGAVCELCAT